MTIFADIMKKLLLTLLKIVGGLLVVLIAALAGVWFYVNSSSGQQRLLGFATQLLQDKLQTRVQIDSISVNIAQLDVNLWGVDVEDQQQRKLLQTDRIAVKLDVKKLLTKKIEVERAWIDGLRAQLYNPKDSAANYQFIIDAFKSNKTARRDSIAKDTIAKKTIQQLTFDFHGLHLSNIYLEQHGVTKKGLQQTTTLALADLTLKPKHQQYLLEIGGLRFTTDNHQPRKNASKPKRGFFDAGHLDITADLSLTVDYVGKDTAHVQLTHLVARDSVSGFDVKRLTLEAGINKQRADVRNIALQHLNTTLNIDSATIQLPSKKQGRKLAYHTSVITGRTLLKDIARPFAPVLGRFSIPLELKTTMSGTDSTMHFRNVHVNTPDQKLKIDAAGDIWHLQNSKELVVHFDVSKMATNAVTAKKIIDQFVVKKFMMRQLNNLGSIGFRGSFDVLYKMEKFRGVLSTSKGYMAVNLVLNENTKYLTGAVRTKGFRLGSALEMKDIGEVGCAATFTFDYSKPRTARIRKLRGGKLPIGKVSVKDAYGSFKNIKFSDINAEIVSNGVVAEGHIVERKKLADLMCDFSFNNTDSIHKMKIKPGLRLKNMPWQRKDEQTQSPSENTEK